MSKLADPPGVVVDCMVFVQAAANEKSPAARILDLFDEGKIKLYVSKLILAEARYVLNRSDVRASLRRLTDVAVEALFDRLDQHATLIRQVPKRFVYPRDPKDEPYVNLAVEMKADYLVSRDNDLAIGDADEAHTIQTDAHLAISVRPCDGSNERSVGSIHWRRILRKEDSTRPRN
jgi:putative PIN family toxin of toxin-antitoxin system